MKQYSKTMMEIANDLDVSFRANFIRESALESKYPDYLKLIGEVQDKQYIRFVSCAVIHAADGFISIPYYQNELLRVMDIRQVNRTEWLLIKEYSSTRDYELGSVLLDYYLPEEIEDIRAKIKYIRGQEQLRLILLSTWID